MSEGHPSSGASEPSIPRRDFLKRLGMAAGIGAGSLALGKWGFERGRASDIPGFASDLYHLKPHYRVELPAGRPGIAAVRGKDPATMVRAVLATLGGPDGIKAFVKKGDVVAVKPNAGFSQPPEIGATTHPDVVAEVVRLCFAAGAKEVRVFDNPIEQFEKCFAASGIRRAALENGARILQPSKDDFREVSVPGAVALKPSWPFFVRPFEGADKVIGLSVLKDHNLAVATMAMKNWYGCLGGPRNQLHQDIHGSIADLAALVQPTLVILDATRILMRSGPTGGNVSDCASANTLVAGTDAVAVDAFAVGLFREMDGNDRRHTEAACRYLALSRDRKIGTTDWKSLNPSLDRKNIPLAGG